MFLFYAPPDPDTNRYRLYIFISIYVCMDTILCRRSTPCYYLHLLYKFQMDGAAYRIISIHLQWSHVRTVPLINGYCLAVIKRFFSHCYSLDEILRDRSIRGGGEYIYTGLAISHRLDFDFLFFFFRGAEGGGLLWSLEHCTDVFRFKYNYSHLNLIPQI